MDKRTQFTFYVSFFKTARRIKNKAARADFYDAICDYALNGVEPDLDKLPDTVAIGFTGARPNLDASRKKAANGKQGGSKPKANGKQTASKKEKENEKEVEIEEENEIEKEYKCINSSSSSCAGAVSAQVEKIAVDLFHRHVGRKPTVSDAESIRNRICFGGKVSEDAAGLLDYAFEAAAKAGLNGNWNYINAVLDRCSLYNIFTAAAARQADEERGERE